MNIRTDLAMEARDIYYKNTAENSEKEGISAKNERIGDIRLTRIEILNERGERALQKPIGTYVTIEAPNLKYDMGEYERVCRLIAREIRSLADIKADTKTLVAGLGNRSITPDALGPETVENLIITNHMRQKEDYLKNAGLSRVCAVAPGVLGTTGMEAVQIIKGVCGYLKPDLVIAVDALAARSLDRISNTFQISNTGISPGSGVGNRREGLNEKTLNTRVIAIGVPTVVDASTLVSDSLETALERSGTNTFDSTEREKMIKEKITKNITPLIVTPRDIDEITKTCAKTVANGINLALHKNLTFEEIESLVR